MFLWDMNYINDVDKTYNYDGLADANYGGSGDCGDCGDSMGDCGDNMGDCGDRMGDCGDRMGRSDRHWCVLCVAHLD